MAASARTSVLLLDIGRTGRRWANAAANAALLAASRGAQPRVAEQARELLPDRYPYVDEFQAALQLDPNNAGLRRELAYLLLEMGNTDAAEREFEVLRRLAPDDRLASAQLGFLKLERRGDEASARPLLESVLKGGDDELPIASGLL